MFVNVKLSEAPKNPHAPYLTRFQTGTPPLWQGKTVELNLKPSDTIATLRKELKKACGATPEIIKKGGSKEGILLDDTKTLQSYGIEKDMSVWEWLWTDSAANREEYAEEYMKMYSDMNTKTFALWDELDALKRHCKIMGKDKAGGLGKMTA